MPKTKSRRLVLKSLNKPLKSSFAKKGKRGPQKSVSFSPRLKKYYKGPPKSTKLKKLKL